MGDLLRCHMVTRLKVPKIAQNDPLVAALLPRVIERAATLTRQLHRTAETMKTARLAGEGGAATLSRGDRTAEVESALDSGHALGWVLGALSSASGTEILLERHEPRGLEYMLEILASQLDTEGLALPLAGNAPLLEAGVGQGWELPTGIARVLLLATRAGDAPLSWGLAPHDGGWELWYDAARSRGLERAVAELLARLPAIELRADPSRNRLRLPGDWLLASA